MGALNIFRPFIVTSHRHVAVALLDHTDAAESVGDADPGGDEGEAHDGVWDAEGEPDHGDHPDHHVAVQADPHHRDQERHHEPQCRLRYMLIVNKWKHEMIFL